VHAASPMHWFACRSFQSSTLLPTLVCLAHQVQRHRHQQARHCKQHHNGATDQHNRHTDEHRSSDHHDDAGDNAKEHQPPTEFAQSLPSAWEVGELQSTTWRVEVVVGCEWLRADPTELVAARGTNHVIASTTISDPRAVSETWRSIRCSGGWWCWHTPSPFQCPFDIERISWSCVASSNSHRVYYSTQHTQVSAFLLSARVGMRYVPNEFVSFAQDTLVLTARQTVVPLQPHQSVALRQRHSHSVSRTNIPEDCTRNRISYCISSMSMRESLDPTDCQSLVCRNPAYDPTTRLRVSTD
jgi:Ni/Co efflux regulator RcnB